jgi:hypothetical protein
LKFHTKPRGNPKRNVAFSFTWRAANLNDFLFLFFSKRREWKNCIVQVLSAENYTFVRTRLKFQTKPCWNPKWNAALPRFGRLQIWMTFYFNFFHSVDNEIIVEVSSSIGQNYTFVQTRLKFKTKPRWNPKWNIAFSCTWKAANLNDYLFLFFFHSVDNEIIVSFKFFQPKIIHLYIYVWNFTRNPVETPKEMSHFHLLEGRQIWMTFYFYFFHSVDNEIIVEVSSSIGRKLYIRTYSVEFKTKPRRNPKWNIAFSCTWRAANLNDYLFIYFFSELR